MLLKICLSVATTVALTGLTLVSAQAQDSTPDPVQELVKSDLRPTAIIFARAALEGDPDAFIRMGELYENDEGLTRDVNLARAWFEMAGTEAPEALLRLPQLGIPESGDTLESPELLEAIRTEQGQVDFIWTSAPGPDPAVYVVQVAERPEEGPIYSQDVKVSALRVILPPIARFWRVIAFEPVTRLYATTPWQSLSDPDDVVSLAHDATIQIVFASENSRIWARFLADDLEQSGLFYSLNSVSFVDQDVTTIRYYFNRDRQTAELIASLMPRAGTKVEKIILNPGETPPRPGEIEVLIAAR